MVPNTASTETTQDEEEDSNEELPDAGLSAALNVQMPLGPSTLGVSSLSRANWREVMDTVGGGEGDRTGPSSPQRVTVGFPLARLL